MEEFAEILKELREEMNLSQRKLSEKINISQATIARWEAKQQIPGADSLIVLSKFFNVSTDYLLGLEN